MSTELLTVDGVDLRQPHMGVATRTGRYGVPSARGDDLVLQGRSGYIFTPNKPLEAGFGALSCWVLGATSVLVDGDYQLVIPADHQTKRLLLERNIGTLQRLFSRRHRLSTIRAYSPDATIRRAFVEFQDMDDPAIQAGGTRAELVISYRIPAVFWEDEDARTQTATAGATLPKVLDLTQFKGMTGFIEDAVFTVPGPIVNPRITDAGTGAYVEYQGTVSSGASWVVDSALFSSSIGAASVLADTRHVGNYRLLSISNEYGSSDTPRLTLSGSGGGASTNLSVTARRKWFSG